MRAVWRRLLVGVPMAWCIALAHWVLVNTGVIYSGPGRWMIEEDMSGMSAFEWLVNVTGPEERETRFFGMGFGWPWPTLAVVTAEVTEPNIFRPDRIYVGLDLSRFWPRPTNAQLDIRTVPLYPLIGQSVVSGLLYGTVWCLIVDVRRARSRRRIVRPCGHCGYDTAGVLSSKCPECGRMWSTAGIESRHLS